MKTLLAFLILAAPALASEPWRYQSKEEQARDRAELVRPAPPGFKPESKKKKAKLKLTARDKKIKAGDKFWYRLELQNVGGEPINWFETSSFFKQGFLRGQFKFFVRVGEEKEQLMHRPVPLPGPPKGDLEFPPGASAAEKERLFQQLRNQPERNQLRVTLAPGETLVSRAWNRSVTALLNEDPDSAIPGDYRELLTMFEFNEPGVYRIKAVYDDQRRPRKYPSKFEKLLQDLSLGLIESNWVTVEVSP